MPLELTTSRPAIRRIPDGYKDPAALLRDLSLHFPALGITRLARQTGLDRLGIPVYAAIRPNSATIATHHGKGLDELSAQVSAVMEAAEYAVAEAPDTPQLVLSLSAARSMGFEILDFTHLLPRDAQVDEQKPVRWVEGVELGTGITVLVPYDAVVLGTDPVDFPGIAQSTNGVGAGTSVPAALFHALCEIVERDAVCLWGYKSDRAAMATALAPAAFDDADVDALDFGIAEAGFRLRLYDQTSNSGLPVIYAVLSPGDGADRHFDAATGAGCHPVAAIAARRAIVEAAQTRITNIAGARDDIVATEYDDRLGRSIAVLADMKELGPGSALEHARIGEATVRLGVDVLIGCGPEMAHATSSAARLSAGRLAQHPTRVAHVMEPLAATALAVSLARPRDVVLVKGSRAMAI